MNDDNLPKESFFNIGVKAAILNSGGQMLALHITRPNRTETYWDLPGGRIADGETPEQTLQREVQEETGITELNIDHHLIMRTSRV
jgi:8-oxo-dGTP diphosphatase